jgi:fructosamine-3-kinase
VGSFPTWPPDLANRLGTPTVVRTVGGAAWYARCANAEVVVKTGAFVPGEVDGLRRLRAVSGGPRVPGVVYHADDWMAIEWIPSGPGPSPGQAEDLGRGLAAAHSAAQAEWGGGAGWVGACPVEPAGAVSAAEFYGARLLELAARCGSDVRTPVEAAAARLAELIPPGPPGLVHGDLWWGNVLWATTDRPAVIDPSAHGGHGEEDLAMLALFGRVPPDLLAAYQEVRPLAPGWERRVSLWQLYPLLVHAVLFGGSYRRRAVEVARGVARF